MVEDQHPHLEKISTCSYTTLGKNVNSPFSECQCKVIMSPFLQNRNVTPLPLELLFEKKHIFSLLEEQSV